MSTSVSDETGSSSRWAPRAIGSEPLRCINLTFHGVGERTRRLEAGEDGVWCSAGQFLTVLDTVTQRTDVRISFDDGNASDLDVALPALRERGLKATFFVVAGRLDTPGFLSTEDVATLSAAGMTIGCHGMHHRAWRRLSDRDLREELLEARRRLEQIAGCPVALAACPFGSYDRRVLSALRRFDYERVFTSDQGTARPDRWLQARNTIRRTDPPDIVARIAGSDISLQRALRRRMRLAVKRWR